MQTPIRRGDLLRKRDDGPFVITAEGLARLRKQLVRLEVELPALIQEVTRTKENGDLSENFEYQDAKHRMRQMHSRIASMKDKISRAVIITKNARTSGVIQLGSTVVLESSSAKKTYEILGPHEADPSRGRISDHSPLGAALLGHSVGDTVTLQTTKGSIEYRIIEVQ